jgi:sugar/nucleoside kinase (ribokinase family)
MNRRETPGQSTPELVVVGAAARDLTPDDPRGWRLGGGVTYGALTSARLGVPTGALIGVDGPASEAAEMDLLRAAGVAVTLVQLERSPVFENIEGADGRIQRCVEPGAPVSVSALPASWRKATAWIMAPVADELPDTWADVPLAGAPVGLGWQGILRDLPRGGLVRRRPPAPSRLLDRATLVTVSRHDVDGEVTVARLLDLLAPDATLVLTQGEAGGLVVARDDPAVIVERVYESIPAHSIVDPTGAGDVFLAGLLCARTFPKQLSRSPDLDSAISLAAAAASLVVEGPGLTAVPWRDDVLRRASAGEALSKGGGHPPSTHKRP